MTNISTEDIHNLHKHAGSNCDTGNWTHWVKTDSLFLSATVIGEICCNPYQILHIILGVTLSTDLKFNIHLNKNVAKSYQYLAFVRRNLTYCQEKLRRISYISLRRSKLEYSSSVWDPQLHNDIHQLDMVQRRAARFIKPNYSHTVLYHKCLIISTERLSTENIRKMNKLIPFRSYFHVLPKIWRWIGKRRNIFLWQTKEARKLDNVIGFSWSPPTSDAHWMAMITCPIVIIWEWRLRNMKCNEKILKVTPK